MHSPGKRRTVKQRMKGKRFGFLHSVDDDSYAHTVVLNVEKSPWPAAKISKEVNKMSTPEKKFSCCLACFSANCIGFHL